MIRIHAHSLFWLCTGLLGALLFAELILQFTDQTTYDKFKVDNKTGLLTYIPDSSFRHVSACIDNTVEINGLGFHGPEVEEKTDNTFRIAIIGSSFVESLQVPVDELFSSILEESLNSEIKSEVVYEVVPVGFSGNGTYLNIAYYDRFVADLEPDLVINLVTDYEVSRNAPSVKYPPKFDNEGDVVLPKVDGVSQTLQSRLKSIARKSKLIMNTHKRVTFARNYVRDLIEHPNVFLKKQKPSKVTADIDAINDEEALWDIEEKLLQAFHSRVVEDDSEYMLVSYQAADDVENADVPLNERLQEISEESEFQYFGIGDIVINRAKEEESALTWSCDGHWSKRGHELVAHVLFEYLQEYFAQDK